MEVIDYSQISVQELYRPGLMHGIPPQPAPHDDSARAKEAKDFYKQERLRCFKTGYYAPDGKWINPIHYFGLNYSTIEVKHKGKKLDYLPMDYWEIDNERLNIIYDGREQKKVGDYYFDAYGIIEAKGRRAHWTTLELEIYTPWRLLAMPEYKMGRLYPDDGTIQKERVKLRGAWAAIPEFLKKVKIEGEGVKTLEVITDNPNEFRIGWRKPSKDGKSEGEKIPYKNAVVFFQVDPQARGAFRGEALGCLTFVEAGKWKNLTAVLAAHIDCFRQDDFVFGQILIGGTSDAITNESTDYKDLWLLVRDQNKLGKKTEFNLVAHFTSAARVRVHDLHTGKEDEEKGREVVLKAREGKRLIKGDKAVASDKQENPITPEEAFLPQGGEIYPSEKINAHIEYIMREGLDQYRKDRQDVRKPEEFPIRRGHIKWVLDALGKPKGTDTYWEDDPDGPCWWDWRDRGMPIRGIKNLYESAIDDCRQDEAEHSDSQNCMVVYQRESYKAPGDEGFMFVYLERDTLAVTYDYFRRIIHFFDLRDVIYERMPGVNDAFPNELKKKGDADRMYYTKGEMGFRPTDALLNEETKYGQEWFKDNRHNGTILLNVLESFGIWRKGKRNTDIGSCVHHIYQILDIKEGIVAERQKKPDEREQLEDTYKKIQEMRTAKMHSYSGNINKRAILELMGKKLQRM